jgi:hypothetical protein
MGSAPLELKPFCGASNFLALFSHKLARLDIRKLNVRIVIHGTNFTEELYDLFFRPIHPQWLKRAIIQLLEVDLCDR